MGKQFGELKPLVMEFTRNGNCRTVTIHSSFRRNGLILPLGELILREACKTFYSLKDKYDLETLTVNVSVVQLMDNNFVDCQENTKETKLEAKYLEIDIKETVFIESSTKSIMF